MRHPVVDLELGEFSWCLHCERVNKTVSWQVNRWECPSCGAGALDMRPWEEVREINQGYPERPEENAKYSQ